MAVWMMRACSVTVAPSKACGYAFLPHAGRPVKKPLRVAVGMRPRHLHQLGGEQKPPATWLHHAAADQHREGPRHGLPARAHHVGQVLLGGTAAQEETFLALLAVFMGQTDQGPNQSGLDV